MRLLCYTQKRFLSISVLRVDWNIFDIIINDEKVVNLVINFGYPFPKAGNILAVKSYDEEGRLSTDDKKRVSTSQDRKSQESGHVNRAREYSGGYGEMKAVVCESKAPDEDHDVVKVYLEPHEGQKTTISPFNVLPRQTVNLGRVYFVLHTE